MSYDIGDEVGVVVGLVVVGQVIGSQPPIAQTGLPPPPDPDPEPDPEPDPGPEPEPDPLLVVGVEGVVVGDMVADDVSVGDEVMETVVPPPVDDADVVVAEPVLVAADDDVDPLLPAPCALRLADDVAAAPPLLPA